MPLLLLLVAKIYLFHPFHVSVCDITYKSDDRHLKISVRIFLDDLEDALQRKSGNHTLDIMDQSEWENINHTLEIYFQENLTITTGKKALDYQYLGSEIEEDVLWSYLEVEKLKPFKSISIENKILTEIFDDQENLVHVRKDGIVRSMRLYGNQLSAEVKWD